MVSPFTKSSGKNVSELDLQFSFHRYRKLRLYFAWVFVVGTAVFSRSTDQGFLVSIPFIVVGEFLRVWSHGYLRKARELATDGPYAHVRNPLYLGNFLIGLGFCVIIWHPIVVSIFVVVFFIVYWITVKGEEQRLNFKFQAAYDHYARSVPRFIPKFSLYSRRSNARFAIHRVLGHGEHITILGIVALYVILYLRQELYQARNPLSFLTGWLFVLVMFLGLCIICSMWLRHWKRGK